MRALIIGTALAASVGLASCGKSGDDAAARPPKKSLARQAVFYAGQEQVTSVVSGTAEPGPTPGTLVLKVDATLPSAGYIDAGFKPRVYAATPPDGIYEVDVVATRPATAAAQAATPVHIEGAWDGYHQDRLKGVKFIAGTNDLTAMLPAK
ncbi:hypothetical protein [Phenylobacterium sp.]|uniref:hypothetical protein n=1 Tax=Phenylobacterium sp. TaxID=1871053 RepID=UPI002F412F93